MPVAEIITIGTELLLGEIQDTNTRYIARALKDAGIDLYRTTTVGDNLARIAQVIQEAMQRSEIIITTGGLGPTVDDPTRQAIALAVGRELIFVPELWDQIQARFQRFGRQATENNKRQAYIPEGAVPVENPVGTAPAFIVETDRSAIVSLPGVPREMEYLMEHAVMPYLQRRFQVRGTIKAVVLHAASVGESQVDELIGDLEEMSNPTVGLAAHPGQIDIRVTAKANSGSEADQMIEPVVRTLRERLGDWVYGTDEETLEDVIARGLSQTGKTLAVVESGLQGLLLRSLAKIKLNFLGGEEITEQLDVSGLKQRTISFHTSRSASLTLGAALVPMADKHELYLVIVNTTKVFETKRSYGSAPQNAPQWAVNVCLDTIRKYLQ